MNTEQKHKKHEIKDGPAELDLSYSLMRKKHQVDFTIKGPDYRVYLSVEITSLTAAKIPKFTKFFWKKSWSFKGIITSVLINSKYGVEIKERFERGRIVLGYYHYVGGRNGWIKLDA